jgi:tetratricopeptide (TPR) repeat protein
MAGILALWAALWLTGCATPQMSQLQQDFPVKASAPSLLVRAALDGVPFFPQDDYQCGPAALAMLAQHAGAVVRPDELTAQVFVPGRQGAFTVEMLAAARRQALLAYPLRPRLEDVLREVASGNPVLVFQNLSLPVYPVWHYAVVIGYDRDRNTVTLRSGVTERLQMSLFTFERTWARGNHWAMVALSPASLPATAQPDSFMAAAAALERVQPAAAQAAYATALQVWPGQRAALLGLGNTAYAQGRMDEAALRFASATREHADFADAWNNLAQVLLEQGRSKEAADAIAQAIGIGGVRAESYRSLQAQVELQRQAGP